MGRGRQVLRGRGQGSGARQDLVGNPVSFSVPPGGPGVPHFPSHTPRGNMGGQEREKAAAVPLHLQTGLNFHRAYVPRGQASSGNGNLW